MCVVLINGYKKVLVHNYSMKVKISTDSGDVVRYGVGEVLQNGDGVELHYDPKTPDVYETTTIEGSIMAVKDEESLRCDSLYIELTADNVIDVDVGPNPHIIPDFTMKTMKECGIETGDVMDSPDMTA